APAAAGGRAGAGPGQWRRTPYVDVDRGLAGILDPGGSMNSTPVDGSLETLLVKLRAGDTTAAERLFQTYEPYLRMVVRRQLSAGLRAKFDSVDVVQSVWADVLRGFQKASWRFDDAAQLRAFLVRATRNRFIDRCRQHQRAVACEQPLLGTE